MPLTITTTDGAFEIPREVYSEGPEAVEAYLADQLPAPDPTPDKGVEPDSSEEEQ